MPDLTTEPDLNPPDRHDCETDGHDFIRIREVEVDEEMMTEYRCRYCEMGCVR